MDSNIMRVLQLVQDGKITAEEAEKLISAMSGKSKSTGTSPSNAASYSNSSSSSYSNSSSNSSSSSYSNSSPNSANSSFSNGTTRSSGTATLDPPTTSSYSNSNSNQETGGEHDFAQYARNFGLPTGELLQQIADDPSIPEHDKLAIIINATSLLCAVLIIQPIPLADFFILTPVQVAGVLAMAQVMGQPIGKNGAGEMVSSIAAVVGGGWIAQQLMIAGVKTLVPIIGVIAIIPVVYAATYGLMTAARAILEAKRTNQPLSESEIRRIKLDAEARAKNEKRDWSPTALRSELESWRTRGEAFKEYEVYFNAEQSKARPLQEMIDRQMERVVQLSTERMNLEQKVRDLSTRLTELAENQTENQDQNQDQNQNETEGVSNNEEERARLQIEHDRYLEELERVHKQWATEGGALESRRAELDAIARNLTSMLQERFERCYPNVRLASELYADLIHMNFPTLIQVERQISLLQFDPVKANYRNEPFVDSGGQEIRQVVAEGNVVLYVASQGRDVYLRAIGTYATEANDIARLRD